MMKSLLALLAASTALAAADLSYTTPQGWKSTPPASSMRVAQFTLPRTTGDTQDAELVVYYFGGEGGGVEENIDRWISQMEQPGGGDSSKVAKRESRKVNGLAVSLVDVTGTYVGGMSSTGGPQGAQAGFRMRAGVIQTPKGNYFIKLTGPQKTVTKWDAAFNQFVGSLKFQ